jgi:hypothetical protein
VSVVSFLNGEAEAPGGDGYCGGALTFYGLLRDPRANQLGFPLAGEAGLLIAFRSDRDPRSFAGHPRRAVHGCELVLLTVGGGGNDDAK